jgi:transcription elongation factor Elf1
VDEITILCLYCGHEFVVKSNGHALAHYERDNSVRWARQGKKLNCPKCNRKTLIFKDYGMQMQRRTAKEVSRTDEKNRRGTTEIWKHD